MSVSQESATTKKDLQVIWKEGSSILRDASQPFFFFGGGEGWVRGIKYHIPIKAPMLKHTKGDLCSPAFRFLLQQTPTILNKCNKLETGRRGVPDEELKTLKLRLGGGGAKGENTT